MEKKMKLDGVFQEMKDRAHYKKPNEWEKKTICLEVY